MAKEKKDKAPLAVPAATVLEQPITETIESNYMPYVMSVIISRALPAIDGFKPSHRKLLYTMYQMGLLSGHRTKSANVVGQTMRLNPHGDAAIYETLVRLTRGNETLLHPFIDSKGSFGKQYSRDMAYAASRYTEVKLDSFAVELFEGIDRNAVDFVPNYDNTTTEPVYLPTTFPNILVSPTIGIAVGMACSICPFHLGEVCDGAIALLRNPQLTVEKLLSIIKAPDFPGGGLLVYDREQMQSLYETGTGSVRLRAQYRYDKKQNAIDILQIPYSTTIESIMKKITDLVKIGRIRSIVDVRDAIDVNGFKLTLDLRKDTDPELLMAKLYRLTPLEDSFDCNFTLLIDDTPRQLGLLAILQEWVNFRMGCVRRELQFTLDKKSEKLHLLLGLATILLDIDTSIRIIRSTEVESQVVPNLMQAFSLSRTQAEYIAEIKLRHLNREYIMNRITEIETLQAEIAELERTLKDELLLKALIADQLAAVKKKYGKPRRTAIIDAADISEPDDDDLIENYAVRVVLTREGYFKKITPQSLKGNDEQKLKEGDEILLEADTENVAQVYLFTDRGYLYPIKISDYEVSKASVLGEYLPAALDMEQDEQLVAALCVPGREADGRLVFVYQNGAGIKTPLAAFDSHTRRRRIAQAISQQAPLLGVFYEEVHLDLLLCSDARRAVLLSTALIPEASGKGAAGVCLMKLSRGELLQSVSPDAAAYTDTPERLRRQSIPAAGVKLP
ncbi:MAG: DNA gyrase subunit A [Eubacteriales bacterium]